MSNSILLGSAGDAPFTLPLEALTTAFGIIGRRGSGKTSTAVVFAEEFIAAALPVVIIDPLGVWFGLRSSADGEGEGLPVTILGGQHGDLPLEQTAGALIADLVVEHPGAYIVDLSGFESRSAERRFATDFAERLYRAKAKDNSALCLIVDEADTFAPQQVRSGEERLLGAFEAIARRGRVRGLGMVLITQRPAVLNKNLLSQIECLIAMQITAPQDREALKLWAQGFAVKAEVEAFLASLAGLQVGEAWIWSPSWLQVFERIKVRRRQTFDSSATPKAGEVKVEPRVLAPVDLEELRTAMAATIERVEADDPKKLKAQIVALQRELARKEPRLSPTCDHETEIAELKAAVQEARRNAELISGALDRERKEFDWAFEGLKSGLEELRARRESIPKILLFPAPAAPSAVKSHPATNAGGQDRKGTSGRSNGASSGTSQPERAGAGITKPRQAILDAIAAFEPVGLTAISKSVIAAYARVSPKSSAYTNNLGALRTSGLVDYPRTGYVALTAAGRELVGDIEPIIGLRELHERWLKLLPRPRARILEELIASYPEDVGKIELAERVEVSATSSAFTNNLGGLRSFGLIDYPTPGRVVATALLFPEGLG